MRDNVRNYLFYFAALLVGFAIPLIILEIVFSYLPVSYPPMLQAVNASNPVPRFEENHSYTWSKGWDFSIRADKRTNNYGFTNDADYIMNPDSKLMVVIGDSFIEAQQVRNNEAVHGVLQDMTGDRGRIYSFGVSGAPLSQYIAFAGFARDEFLPDAMVFSIVSNDFDESLAKYKQYPGAYYFSEGVDGYELQRVDYSVSPLKKMLRKSSLVRYALFNLGIKQALNSLSVEQQVVKEYVANVPAHVSSERLVDSKHAVDEFLRRLPVATRLPASRILFVVDGSRPSVYSDEGLENAAGSYAFEMRSYFIGEAARLGYETRDLLSVFRARNRQDGSRFEFSNDGHWNQLGHELVAGEIASSRVYTDVFGQ